MWWSPEPKLETVHVTQDVPTKHDQSGLITRYWKTILIKRHFPQLVERAFSDSQQRRLNNNNGPTPQPASPLAQRRNSPGLGSGVGSGAIYGTPTRV